MIWSRGRYCITLISHSRRQTAGRGGGVLFFKHLEGNLGYLGVLIELQMYSEMLVVDVEMPRNAESERNTYGSFMEG